MIFVGFIIWTSSSPRQTLHTFVGTRFESKFFEPDTLRKRSLGLQKSIIRFENYVKSIQGARKVGRRRNLCARKSRARARAETGICSRMERTSMPYSCLVKMWSRKRRTEDRHIGNMKNNGIPNRNRKRRRNLEISARLDTLRRFHYSTVPIRRMMPRPHPARPTIILTLTADNAFHPRLEPFSLSLFAHWHKNTETKTPSRDPSATGIMRRHVCSTICILHPPMLLSILNFGNY